MGKVKNFFVALGKWFNLKDRPKRILIINSYSSIEPWTRDLNAGFQEYLSKRKINAHYDYQELDVRGTLDVKPPLQTVRRLQELLKNTHYDLIVKWYSFLFQVRW